MTWQRWKGIMKCYPFEESRLAKWTPPFIVQPKYDGDRCKAYPLQDNSFLLLTSEENPYFSVPHINWSLASSGIPHILDGELYSHSLNIEGGHELIHSIVSRTVNLHPRLSEISFYIFDLEVPEPQIKRLLMLQQIKDMNLPFIRVAPHWICDSLKDIKNVYDRLVSSGYEGIIIRNFVGAYEHKRSTMIMKFKPKRSDTYKIIGYNEEISKDGFPKDRLGSLTLSSQSGDTFNVSAGLNDKDRASLWDIKESLPGLNATVYYQHLTNKQIPKGAFDIKVHLPEKETPNDHI